MSSGDLLPIRVLHDFTGRMDLLKIPYMLTGSMAMFQYSAYRMTADIDIVLELKTPAGPAFIKELEPDYYIPHGSMMRAIESEGIFNVIHHETAFKVDCVLRKSTTYQATAFGRRATVDFHRKDISIITAEDLIISKLLWSRDTRSERQLSDVKNLLRNPLDVNYIESWAERLDIMEAYENCRGEIGI